MVVAVLTRVVAVLTTVVAVLECRRFGMSPFLLSPFRLVAVMTGTQSQYALVPPVTGDIYTAGVFSVGACGCSVSTVTNPFPLANLYRMQPIARKRCIVCQRYECLRI